jgi:putative ABC transport system permease protein
MNSTWWFFVADGLFRRLLFLYPRSFREQYGDEMARLFRERCQRAAHERGRMAACRTGVVAMLDTVITGLAERAAERRASRRRSGAAPRRGDGMLSRLAHNLRYGWRTFRRQPGFTVMLVGTLAIGTGATTALFTIVDAALVRPLPYPEPDRLVSLLQRDARFDLVPFAPPYLEDLRERSTSYSQIVGFSPTWELTLTGVGEARVVPSAFVSDGLLAITGITLASGRDFTGEEHKAGAQAAALVTRPFWDRTFGPNVPLAGQIIRLDDKPFTIVGILAEPAGLPVTTSVVSRNSTPAQVWLPFVHNPLAQVRTIRVLNVMARLKPGVTVVQAEAELRNVGLTLRRDYPEATENGDFVVVRTADLISRSARRIILVLFGAAVCLLLIACVNAANLLLARSSARRQELAVRASLGASRGRIAEQLLTESLLVGAAGSAGGLLVAWWLLSAVPALQIGDLPPTAEIAIDRRVAAFAVLLTVVTSVLFGLVPAWLSSRGAAATTLRGDGRAVAGWSRARGALVVLEAALALTLLIGAGLLSRTLWQMTSVPLGFRTEGVIGIPIGLPESRYATPGSRRAFFDEALNRLAQVPGVQRASAVNRVPLSGSNVFVGVEVEGQAAGGERPAMDRRVSVPGYFQLMDIPLVRGRDFASSDSADTAHRVAILNDTAARRYWGDGDALGRRIRLMLRSGPGPWLTIVGVVGSVQHHQLDQAPQPEVYVPYAQASVERMFVLIRTGAEADTLLPAAKAAIWSLDRNVPLDGAGPLGRLLFEAAAQPRFRALVFSAFAALALGLAAIGIYGVISYSVARRLRDIGVRVALGAQSRDIVRMILTEGLALTALGLAAGLVASLVLSRLLAGLLFGVSATDPLTFTGASAVLLIVAATASYIPARRAARLDPVAALRLE